MLANSNDIFLEESFWCDKSRDTTKSSITNELRCLGVWDFESQKRIKQCGRCIDKGNNVCTGEDIDTEEACNSLEYGGVWCEGEHDNSDYVEIS